MRRRRRHTGTTAWAHRSAATSSASVVLWVEIDAQANSNPLFAPIRNTDTPYKLHELPNYRRRLPTLEGCELQVIILRARPDTEPAELI